MAASHPVNYQEQSCCSLPRASPHDGHLCASTSPQPTPLPDPCAPHQSPHLHFLGAPAWLMSADSHEEQMLQHRVLNESPRAVLSWGPQDSSQTSRTFYMCVYICGYSTIFDGPSDISELSRTDNIMLCDLCALDKYYLSLPVSSLNVII